MGREEENEMVIHMYHATYYYTYFTDIDHRNCSTSIIASGVIGSIQGSQLYNTEL